MATTLIEQLRAAMPAARVVTDELRRIAYGTDASFYRLVPRAVVFAQSEDEVRAVLALCRAHSCSLTFRAAGTSLSGQAVTDGVLVVLGDGWAESRVERGGALIRLGPGVVGAAANRLLAPFGRKIGPDPASINACKIGGIAANNASGMCCGTAQNSYRTLAALRVMLADGTVVDSADPESVAGLRASHAPLLAGIAALAKRVRGDTALAERIRHKYRLKNTTGYSLNALIDFDDPLDILIHLMIGSEGTLGFISRVDYHTVVEHRHKASALLLFADLASACDAVVRLKAQAVAAVELLDRASIRAVEHQPGIPGHLRTLGADAAALLVETRAADEGTLTAQIAGIVAVLADVAMLAAPEFSSDAAACERLWNVRKGVFPSVGAMRRPGTTVLIEDVAFPVERLAAATLDLQALMHVHGYDEGVIYGHALDGNLHFIFTQDFGDPAEVARYGRFLDAVCHLVVDKYDGSLKAEHGTGRNMAPYVALEWGGAATALMGEIKRLFDPDGILNPDVILATDPRVHVKNLKPMPRAHALVDRCIECGFCEPQCPSAGLSFSPRQRIVATRALADATDAAAEWRATYRYQGMATCAGCGLCSTVCPVGIDTGALVREQRHAAAGALTRMLGNLAAGHFDVASAVSRGGLRLGRLAAAVVGDAALERVSGGAWRSGLRAAAPVPACGPAAAEKPTLVYFPGCAGRLFASGEKSLAATIVGLCERAGYHVVIPEERDLLCCGQPFWSKGLFDAARRKADELEATLVALSAGGRHAVVFDASACALRMKEHLAGRLEILDFIEFAHDRLLPRFQLRRRPLVALHLNCSARRMGLAEKLRALARACADTVVEPADVTCCGFGGDRGFAVPELNEHALRKVRAQIPVGCKTGYSSNTTCEIGLGNHTGIPYRSIAHLLEESLIG